MITFCGEERFTYWTDAVIVDIDNADDLIDAYQSQDGEHHYFDSDTMDFFGTEDFHMVAPGISVEYQSNAPDGVNKWTVVSWVWREDGEQFIPYTLCRHDSLSDAAICGHISYQHLDPNWNAIDYDTGYCSDHGEPLHEGCQACEDENDYDSVGCFAHGYAYDSDCRQCDSF